MSQTGCLVRSKRASTKSNNSTASTVSSGTGAAGGAACLFGACFGAGAGAGSGAAGRANPVNADAIEKLTERLAYHIQLGNTRSVERILRKLRAVPPSKVVVSVKRRHLSPNFLAWTNRSQDPFLHFHQECSPVVWAVDNQQWQMLPILAKYGHDPNRPLQCKRWNFSPASSNRSAMVPYKKFWTKGRYTYQSALDYYFGSIYEFLGEEMQRMSSSAVGYSSPSTFYYFFQQLPQLLLRGIDVHRIDSIILFNSLGYSLNWYLTKYTNENNTVPDIPEQNDSCAEIFTVRSLIKAGFSEFECLEFLSSSHNWFGILICLLCHPRLDQYGSNIQLPPIIQEAALLLINFLSLSSSHPTSEEISESLENLSLRKLYAKRYSQRRQEFKDNLETLQRACSDFNKRPMSLRLQARNAVRRNIGGVDFGAKLRRLAQTFPAEVVAFLSYVDMDSLHLLHPPRVLLKLAKRENPFSTEDAAEASSSDGESAGSTSHEGEVSVV
ncbi:hypothetical protein BOX15_Mlig011658g1 [Macrostomum lignano]|uniref:SOCS box domain-containing protein n=1 Tax=Macrostomum lignano TaxID=282301 RepID=A0A267GAJ4_9PLAT|nr:hypothetical protein BOX15_Mlig011658g2 [Macrostomum lignano]PAA83065.1 hypothetical protein BOX15_Mlig011658g3 [Macrostomum lignano]PAA89115.1 hypothetical protein BOX15_Mlig011658g1 [Macrostomum lignano]